jgi:hypothetical protein
MDWDGIGTFALFIGSGAIGVGMIMLRAYKATLAAKLEGARLERSSGDTDYAQEQIRELEDKVRRLSERVEFNEKLLTGDTATHRGDELAAESYSTASS